MGFRSLKLNFSIRKKIQNLAWENVDLPDAAFNYIPFNVQRSGRVFRADLSWDLLAHASMPSTKIYYVDGGSGNDVNSGLSWITPLRTPNAAFSKTDVDVVYVRNGFWFRSECNVYGTRSLTVIGDGTAVFTADQRNRITSMTKVGNHWEVVFSSYAYMSNVFDEANPNLDGYGTRLAALTSVVSVDSTPGSWWYNYLGTPSNTLYIRLLDERQPDALVVYRDSGPTTITADNRKLYFENIRFYGGPTLQNTSSTGGFKAYFKGCSFFPGSLTISGLDEVILEECSGSSSGDIFNYDVRNTIIPKIIEKDCRNVLNDSTVGSDQASTIHNGSICISINPTYGRVGGQVIGDAGASSRRWVLGGSLSSPYNGVGLYTEGITWADRVRFNEISVYDMQASGAAIIYNRDCLVSKGISSGNIQVY